MTTSPPAPQVCGTNGAAADAHAGWLVLLRRSPFVSDAGSHDVSGSISNQNRNAGGRHCFGGAGRVGY